jgi:hypothetical protein
LGGAVRGIATARSDGIGARMQDGRQLLQQAFGLHQRGDLAAARLAEFSTTPSDAGSSARAFTGSESRMIRRTGFAPTPSAIRTHLGV